MFDVLNPEITFSSGNLMRITINFYSNWKSQGLCHKGKRGERHLVASFVPSKCQRKYGAAAHRNGAAAVEVALTTTF